MNSKRRTTLLLAALTLALTAMAAPSQAAGHGASSTSAIATFADPTTTVGRSHLVRTDSGVIATYRTSGLQASEALTLWWVVFNDPGGCTGPCGEDEIFVDGDPQKGLNWAGIEAADIVAGYADGVVSDAKGRAFMKASVQTGGDVDEIIFGDGPILKDSITAEIHLVARSHGPAVPGLIDVQIGSYAGGCDVFLLPPEVPQAVGECSDIQFSVHLP